MCTRMKRAKLLKLESVQALGADGGIFIISAFPLHQSCCVDLTRPMKSFRLHLRPKNLLFLKLMEKYVRRDSLVHSYQCFRNFISSSEENLSFSGSVRAHRQLLNRSALECRHIAYRFTTAVKAGQITANKERRDQST